MKDEATHLLEGHMEPIPRAPFAMALQSRKKPGRFIPQTISHRGYKSAYPENTMAAFKGAAAVGTHALETDLHLSKDGVVVLSHDANLKRCFGVDKMIKDCEWEDLRALRTVRKPSEGMPRLKDLLVWLNESARDDIWIVLDIKIDDPADDLMSAVAQTLEDVPGVRPWDERIVLGCWNATFIKASRHYLPSFPIVHISFYLPYAKHFLPIPHLGFNIFQRALVGYPGSRFLRQARKYDRPVYAWTVNDERWMEWCIRKNMASGGVDGSTLADKLIDGVITDDPKKFLDVCDRVEDEADGRVPKASKGPVETVKTWGWLAMQMLVFEVFSRLFFALARRKGRFDYPSEIKGADDGSDISKRRRRS